MKKAHLLPEKQPGSTVGLIYLFKVDLECVPKTTSGCLVKIQILDGPPAILFVWAGGKHRKLHF